MYPHTSKFAVTTSVAALGKIIFGKIWNQNRLL